MPLELAGLPAAPALADRLPWLRANDPARLGAEEKGAAAIEREAAAREAIPCHDLIVMEFLLSCIDRSLIRV